jgi:hypothetical protein
LVVNINDDPYPFPPTRSSAAATLLYLAGWLAFKALRAVRNRKVGDYFRLFAEDFKRRSTWLPHLMTPEFAKKLGINLTKCEQRFLISGFPATYARPRLYAFTNFLEGVCSEALDNGAALGPTAMLSIQQALLTSPVTRRMLLDVYRERELGPEELESVRTEFVSFESADLDRVDENIIAFFDNDETDFELDRAFGAVLVDNDALTELLTLLVCSYIQMRGRDTVRSIMGALTSKERSENAIGFRGGVDIAKGRENKKRRVADDDIVPPKLDDNTDDTDDLVDPISSLAEDYDAKTDRFVGGSGPPLSHVSTCDCGERNDKGRYCKLDPHWACTNCKLGAQTYYVAAACCNGGGGGNGVALMYVFYDGDDK